MLKKSFSILAAFILGLIISISIMACADDTSDYSNDKDTLETLAAKVADLEKEVRTLKGASIAQNIRSYSYVGDEGRDYMTFTYDKTGRLTQVTCDYDDGDPDIWTCSYNKNVCTLTCSGDEDGGICTFTLTDEDSQDFHALQNIIISLIVGDFS